MAQSIDLRAVSEIAHGFVGQCDQFLTENLGRPYNVQEIAQFSETATSALLASAYVNFREHMGKEAAEAWLKKTLAVAASTIRLMGADALVRFEVHVKDMPNKLHRMAATSAPAPAAPAPVPPPPVVAQTPTEECKCVLDKAGVCRGCVQSLSEAFKGTFKVMELTKKAQSICKVCSASQADRALASAVPIVAALEVPVENLPGFRREMVVVFQQLAQAQGATSIPITEKAWKEACEAKA